MNWKVPRIASLAITVLMILAGAWISRGAIMELLAFDDPLATVIAEALAGLGILITGLFLSMMYLVGARDDPEGDRPTP